MPLTDYLPTLQGLDSNSNLTPEQIKRLQEHAYALLGRPYQGEGGRSYTSIAQPVGDILSAISGRNLLNQTNQSDVAGRQQQGQISSELLTQIQNKVAQQKQVSAAPAATPPITTGAITPPEINGDDIIKKATAAQSAINNNKTNTPEGVISPTGNEIEPPKAGYKIDDYLKRLFEVESSNNPSAKKGSYRGLAQFSSDLEKKYGINDDNWQDPTTQIRAAAQHSVENAKSFKERFGHEPSNGELYLMHQQGTTGGMNIVGSEPFAPAWKTIKDSAKVSDAVAKQRILQNIPVGSELAKKPVEQITNQEFGRLWTSKFDMPKPMGLGGPKAEDNSQSGAPAPSGPQIAQANGIPPAVTHPAGNIDPETLAKYMANPRISEDQKEAIQKMMIEGAQPRVRETPSGPQEFRGSDPTDTSMTGGQAHYHPFSAGGINTTARTTINPKTGQTETKFLLPDGGWGTISDIREYGRKEGALDTREASMAGKYAEKEQDIQQRTEGAARNRQLLSVARMLSRDPSFYSGTGANRVLDYTKMASYLTGNPNWSGSSEAFGKIIAGANIAGLEAFKGLGQIRNPEIELLRESQGTNLNSQGAIEAIITMNDRAGERLEEIGQKMREYRKVHKRLDEGFDEEMAKFYKDRPLFTDEEVKNYRKTLFGDKAVIKSEPTRPTGRTFNPATGKFE